MSVPLPDSISDQLKDPTTALAAAFVIANHHPGILQWAARMVGANKPPPRRKPRKRKANGAAPKSHDADAYLSRRRAARDRDDEELLETMRTNPDGTINDWAMAIGKSRSSVVTALHRLRDVDLAESTKGKWKLAEPPAPKEKPRWVEPVSGAHRAPHSHLTAAS